MNSQKLESIKNSIKKGYFFEGDYSTSYYILNDDNQKKLRIDEDSICEFNENQKYVLSEDLKLCEELIELCEEYDFMRVRRENAEEFEKIKDLKTYIDEFDLMFKTTIKKEYNKDFYLISIDDNGIDILFEGYISKDDFKKLSEISLKIDEIVELSKFEYKDNKKYISVFEILDLEDHEIEPVDDFCMNPYDVEDLKDYLRDVEYNKNFYED
ncbi:hypothetical protein [Pseudostreptobacillus hongkongensis]|uniref:hypothetical protein n=1 Tax=Pseudostreptobacillus hongkongensis TaxID=1162717 RepID=UPI00082B16BD|nr:hypothetical protein [Pseudostreptobacillus hongkongensis]